MTSDSFVYAPELKKVFDVLGSFYNVSTETGSLYQCRATIEIIRQDVAHDVGDLLDRRPDAFAVMMNPGASRPKPSYEPVFFNAWDFDAGELALVPTVPDQTQYQLMRAMLLRNLRHIRVLNLSDLRQGKGEQFLADLPTVEAQIGALHAIWHEKRAAHRERLLDSHPGVPVITGCSLDNKLLSLANLCLPLLDGRSLVGVAGNNQHPLLKKHPGASYMSQKLAWVEGFRNLEWPSTLEKP